MTEREFDPTAAPRAELFVEPTVLDFGEIKNAAEIKNAGQAVLTVTNHGDRVLVGQFNVQVGWIEVHPETFRLNPGESSSHVFSITKLTPTVWTTHRLGSDFIALITSNGGSAAIGGYYYSPIEETRKEASKHAIRKDTLYVILALIMLAAGLILGSRLTLRHEDQLLQTRQIAAIYTEAVETLDARATEAAPTNTPLFGVSDPDEFNAIAAAYGASLISNISSDSEPTNTPWPSGKYPSAQQFLFTYYTYLNDKDYDSAWWLLSESMQLSCCSTGAGTPIENYRSSMSEISSFNLVSAYLQAENVNPAEVRFEVIYYYADGTEEDNVLTAYIIDDAERNTLLIDEIK